MSQDIHTFLDTILGRPETEIIEFKLAGNNFDTGDLCKYISALANEANLKQKEKSYLIFGVEPKKHTVIGTDYREEPSRLDSTKQQIFQNTKHSVNVFSIEHNGQRLVIFEVPPSPQGIVIESNGFAYAREGESLVALSRSKREQIESQKSTDWSNIFHSGSSFTDLDDTAMDFVRNLLSKDLQDPTWKTDSIEKICNRLQLTNERGEMNNTALLFLGKHESAIRHLHPDICKITWRYIDIRNSIEERLPSPLHPPFIFALPRLIENINRFNVTIGDLSLFREDIKQYDAKSIEEMLVNSLAHRDWNVNMWNEVIQTPDQLEVRNPGGFYANLEDVLIRNYARDYRCPNLCEFLTKIKLMERERRGLEKVYTAQLRKGLQVIPDFLPERTSFILGGKIKNPVFAKALLVHTDIFLDQLLILDKLIDAPAELSESEIEKVGNFVEKQKRTNSFTIKASFLQENSLLDEHFLDSHSSLKTKEQVFLDFARKNKGKITPKNGYTIFPNDPQSSIRVILMTMEKEGILKRISHGEYEIVKRKKN